MKRLQTISWALFDFANTVFAFNVVVIYFPLFVTQDLRGEEFDYSLAISLSMAAVALTTPVLGTVSDKLGHRKAFLGACTLLSVVCTGLLGRTSSLAWTLVFFGLANYGYQAGMTFYNALLPAVSAEKTLGRVSGLGVALGYVGAVFSVAAITPFVSGRLWRWDVPSLAGGGNAGSFLPAAVLFGLFALPLFIWVRDAGAPGFRQQRRVVEALAEVRRHPRFVRFMLARLFYLDGINTTMVFMSVYLIQVAGFDGRGDLQIFYAINILCAAAGAAVMGSLADRWGHRRTLMGIVTLFVSVTVMVTVTPHKFLFWIWGPVLGIGLAGVWTSERAFLVTVAPPGMVGEFFGIYSMAGKLAAIAGPLQCGLLIKVFAFAGVWKYRIAMASLIFFFLPGLLLLRRAGKGYAPRGDPGSRSSIT